MPKKESTISSRRQKHRFDSDEAAQICCALANCGGGIMKPSSNHLYRGVADPEATSMTVALERTFDDVTMQGKIEGLSFDREDGRLLISYNRGAQVVLGKPLGFYEGYEAEIHEIFVYAMEEIRR